jgi:hypothetical protein
MRNQKRFWPTLPAVVLSLALACVLPTFSLAGGPELVRVATIPGGLSGTLPCGNLYHDGHVELVGSVDNSMEVIDDTGWNEYRVRHINFPQEYAYALGEGNGDGLTELITNYDSLCVWKQAAPESFPSHLVFWDTTMMHYGCCRVEFCDLDNDGHTDILANIEGYGPSYLWENRGGDTYEPVPFPTQNWWRVAPIDGAIGDFDGDGLMEVGGGGWTDDALHQGGLAFFECCGNDSYFPTCTIPQPPGQSWDPVVWSTAARNMEGDGLSEFVSVQMGLDEQSGLILMRIVKEPIHNQFVEVCTLNFSLGPWFGPDVAAGDVDGDGRDELAVSTVNDVRIVKYVGPGHYATECIIDKPNVTDLRMFDLNQDGHDELIFATDSTYIYEDTSGLGIAEFSKFSLESPVKVSPSVASLGASLLFSGVPPGADIEVLSLDGRLVSRASGVRQSTWTWNLRDRSGNLVPAGTYFAVIRSKGKSTSLKLCLVR